MTAATSDAANASASAANAANAANAADASFAVVKAVSLADSGATARIRAAGDHETHGARGEKD